MEVLDLRVAESQNVEVRHTKCHVNQTKNNTTKSACKLLKSVLEVFVTRLMTSTNSHTVVSKYEFIVLSGRGALPGCLRYGYRSHVGLVESIWDGRKFIS